MRVLLVARGSSPTKRERAPPSLRVASSVLGRLEKDWGCSCILVLITSAGWVVAEASRPATSPQGSEYWEGSCSTDRTAGGEEGKVVLS